MRWISMQSAGRNTPPIVQINSSSRMASSSSAAELLGVLAPDQEPSQLQQLPRVLLQRILSSLDLYTVLEVSTVSREFRTAAAAALSRINLRGVRGLQLMYLCNYLRRQGNHHLTSLTLSSDPDDLVDDGPYSRGETYFCRITRLPPLPSLQQLSLAGFILQLGPVDGSSEPGVLAATGAQLTLLSIDKCQLLDGPSGLEAVSALRSLRHLHLGWAGLEFKKPQHPSNFRKDDKQTFPGSLLSVLVQLTHLSIGLAVDTPSLQHLSCLTGLQELLVQEDLPSQHAGYGSFQPSDLAALQHAQQLSKVVLGIPPAGKPLSASALHQLRAVKHLALEVRAPFDTAVLAPLAQLQHLQYTEGFMYGYGNVRAGIIGGPGALLGQLALHTQLTFLQLDYELHVGPEVPAAALSAITASSQLQHLVLRIPAPSTAEQSPFQAVWQHVFPEQLQLPHLRHVTLESTSRCWDPQPTLGTISSRAGSNEAPPPWQDQCVSRLALCCPHLQGLNVMQALNNRVSLRLTPLLQLPHLTALTVHHMSRAGARAVAAQMRGLVRLEVGWRSTPGCISAASLARLTPLQLTHLGLTGDDNFAPQDEWEEAGYEYRWGADKAAEMRAYAPYRVVDATLAVIARLSSLQELLVKQHRSITDVGLLQLSALRQLTHLDVRHSFGLLGFDQGGTWVKLPTKNWRPGITLGQPVWPELLERVLRCHERSTRQQAQQAVLANRHELLGVLGPALAAALPRMRFHRSYEELDGEVERWGVDMCSWGPGSGTLSSAASIGSSDWETDDEQAAPCEPFDCTTGCSSACQAPLQGKVLPGAAAGSPAGPAADNPDQGFESGNSSGAVATAAAVGPSASEAPVPSAAGAAIAADPVGTWQQPGGSMHMPPGGTAAAAAPDTNAGVGAAAGAGEGAEGATGGISGAAADRVIMTAATAMRERLSFVVRLLATHRPGA